QMDLEVDGCKGQMVNVGAFFQWQNGTRLLGVPGSKYCTTDGQVTTQRNVVPQFVITNINNLELFIPYSELDLGIPGNYNLRFFVDVARNTGAGWQPLTATPTYNFNLKTN